MAGRQRSGVVLGAPATPPVSSASAQTRTQAAADSAAGASSLIGWVASLGPRGYLYLLVLLEVAAIGLLRYTFRDHHGG